MQELMRDFNLTRPQVEEALNWYFTLNEYIKNLAFIYKVHPVKVAGILSALSPMVNFRTNLAFTEAFLKGDYANVKTFSQQKTKAYKILTRARNTQDVLKILNGDKTKAFFLNIAFPKTSQETTLDTHMLQIYGYKSWTPKRYRETQKELQNKARVYNVMPHQLQALLWCEKRGSAF